MHKGVVEIEVVQNQKAKVADWGGGMLQEKREVFKGERLGGKRSRELGL